MNKDQTELLQGRLADIQASLSASEQMLANLRDAAKWEFLTEELEVNVEELIADYEARIARDEHLQDALGQLLSGQAI